VGGHRISVADSATERFWQIAILTVVGALGTTSPAKATLYYWQYSDPGYYRPDPQMQPPRQKARRHSAKKDAVAKKETGAKPQGPLIISVSISKQQVKIYDANGFFAEAPVSTGMRGHGTPMGVFSVIQKHKWHRSNIYSGAPMPYMQRITWSGVAMHAGVLPGYPASHGCIRMPMAFAIKMWNWTKMGARVFVTPGEMSPANFSNPLLPAFKVAPQPAVADVPQTDAPPAAKVDKGASETKPATSETNLELRPTVGHNAVVKPATDEAATPLREQTHTADASGGVPADKSTMSDASSATAARTAKDADTSDAAKVGTSAEAKKPNSDETAAKRDETVALAETRIAAKADGDDARSDEPIAASVKAEAKSVEAESVEAKPVEAKSVEAKPVEVKSEEAKPEAATAESKASAPKQQDMPKVDEAKSPTTEPSKTETAKPNEQPANGVKAANETAPSAADAKKDPTRLLDADKPAAAKAEPPKRTGQISVFISRKDSKLYVRQNFAPLYEVPVTISPSDRPLGTHVFTAEADKIDANVLHWSVVSLPVTVRASMRDEDERASRHRKIAGGAAIEAKSRPVPDSPAEALDRITIPADTMARIAEAMTTGGSIIVSDQGINQGETGEGTDFIVSLR
jgi:lipoprotein-anchoring transpeptidase ErfK/SrfK